MTDQENPVTDTDRVIRPDAVLTTPVADNGKVVGASPANKGKAARKTVTRLFLYTEKADKPFGQIRHQGAVSREVADWKQLVTILGEYAKIETLVLMTHSTAGTLLVGKTPKSGDEAAAELGKSGARANKVIFEGCMMMRDPVEAAQIAQGVHANTAVGYNWWHYVGKRVWTFKPPMSDEYDAELRGWMRERAKYIVQPSAGPATQPETIDALIKALEKKSPLTLQLEWFFRSGGGGSEPDPLDDVARGELKLKQISDAQQAQAFAAENHSSIGAHLVSVDVGKVAPQPKP